MGDKRNRARQEVVDEFGESQLGDERLTARLKKIARAAVRQPSKSLPEQSGSDAALKALYRFLDNPHVTPEQILAPHVAATVERCEARKRVIVAHDTTEAAYEGREEFGYLSGEKRGFLGHFALAVAADEYREPLGVVHVETMVRAGEPEERKRGDKTHESESLRWNRTAVAAHELLGPVEAIHVFDREGDNYALMAEMVARGQRFVVRAAHDRSTEDGKVSEILEGAQVQA